MFCVLLKIDLDALGWVSGCAGRGVHPMSGASAWILMTLIWSHFGNSF